MKPNQIALYGLLTLILPSIGFSAALRTPMVQVTSSPVTVTEGDLVRFDFKMSRPAPLTGLNVRLTLYRDSDPLPGDVEYFVEGSRNVTGFDLLRDATGQITDAIVAIAPGARTATLVSKTLDDDAAEGEEHVVYRLANSTGYRIHPKNRSATFTITDRPVISLTLGSPPPFREGGFMDFRFHLSRPAPTGGLPVRLALLKDTDPEPGDVRYFVEGSQGITDTQVIQRNGTVYHLLVNIAEGVTDAVLRSAILTDKKTERPEIGVFGLAAGSGYSIDTVHAEITFRLID
jgi:hypothetical protein